MSEHKGTPLTGGITTGGIPTAVRQHTLNTGHNVSFSDFSILAYADSKFLLEIKQSLFILRDNPAINKNLRSVPLYLYN